MPKDVSFAERLLQESTAARPSGSPVPALEPKSEEREESAITTRTSNQPTLQLRFKDGRECAVPYPYITWSDYDPSTGIRIETPSRDVYIQGTGLSQVFRQIASHKRQTVDELTSPSKVLAMNGERSHIAAIHVKPHEEVKPPPKPRKGDSRSQEISGESVFLEKEDEYDHGA